MNPTNSEKFTFKAETQSKIASASSLLLSALGAAEKVSPEIKWLDAEIADVKDELARIAEVSKQIVEKIK